MYEAEQLAHGILYTTFNLFKSGIGFLGLDNSCLRVCMGLKQTLTCKGLGYVSEPQTHLVHMAGLLMISNWVGTLKNEKQVMCGKNIDKSLLWDSHSTVEHERCASVP